MAKPELRAPLDENSAKYKALEPILQEINRKCISISDSEKRDNQSILEELIPKIINEMKMMDNTFRKLYRHNLYAGSTYDNLKISKPDEFDLDAVFVIPEHLQPTLIISNIPGFVEIKLNNFNASQVSGTDLSKMTKFVDKKNYLETKSFRSWFEGLLKRATEKINQYNFRVRKSGPAFTLEIEYKNKIINIDLVPSFVFGAKYWPQSPFRKNVTGKSEFLIIPKDLPDANGTMTSRKWRLSFNEQERELMNGKNRLKDAIRLLKRIRDEQGQNVIASYYIKTIILWMAEYLDNSFWQKSLSYVFMAALKHYQLHLDKCEIPYYWNKRSNLLNDKNSTTYKNGAYRIQRIIKDIERNLESKEELRKMMFKYFD